MAGYKISMEMSKENVTDPEPITATDPLVKLPNVIVAPHIASATVRTRSEMSAMAARNMATAVRGGRPPNLLNPEVKR